MDCLFCNLIKEKNNQTFLYEFDSGIAYLNHNQFFYGRIMYIVKTHWTDVSEMPIDIYQDSCRDIHLLSRVIRTTMKADLINIASLGNHVQHTHWHIIPRYVDDPCWGSPPWPHGEKLLTATESEILGKRIQDAIITYI